MSYLNPPLRVLSVKGANMLMRKCIFLNNEKCCSYKRCNIASKRDRVCEKKNLHEKFHPNKKMCAALRTELNENAT